MIESSYTKLFSSIVTSSIWQEDDQTRLVWLTMLALKNRFGEVSGSIPGLANIARVPVESARNAIKRFLSPDPDSRSKEYAGRRIEEIEGGWRILNHKKYREAMSKAERLAAQAAWQREYRQRKKKERVDGIVDKTLTHTDTDTKKPRRQRMKHEGKPKATCEHRQLPHLCEDCAPEQIEF